MSLNNNISQFINISVKKNEKHMFRRLLKFYSHNSIQRGIIELCIENDFFNYKRVKKLKGGSPMPFILQMLKYGILEKSELTSEEKKDLYRQKGMNYYNINTMIIYRLTKKATLILNKTGLKDYIWQNIKKWYMKIYTMSKKKFNYIFSLRKKLQAIDINKLSTGIFVGIHWEDYGINNAFEFMQIKIRKICEYIPFTKTGFQRLEQRICELVDTPLKQLRTVITNRTITEHWKAQ